MKKIIFMLILVFSFNFFIGCHTLNSLSRVHTGHVDLKDIYDAVIADDHDFQEIFW